MPGERGPNGEPSTNDFQVVELFRIVERFAVGFDELPVLFAGRTDYRVLVVASMLVLRIGVTGLRAADGAVELVALDIDLDAGWE